ncbi:putative major facilitator superfamily protein [Erysiphe neolycopersici]|uniref:Putative major facilitator superfamily protein n=1 Tax=Erysiphe neolycopersici TaxID=212602 RepID=A0A420HVU1_9PEZI|nr:putative major facilitator superfamily protein [Erysiphe neolycopersici]
MVHKDLHLSIILNRNRIIWPAPVGRRLIPIYRLIRNSSSRAYPHVLEKPEKFNPPSHGSRLRNPTTRYYGPQMTAEELAQQKSKKYPNMMPPEGTFMHWFLHNKLIHLWLSMGILTSLAVTVMVTNFKRESPFADMLPEWYNMFLHPIRFWRTIIEVIKLDTARTSAEAAEKRKQRVDDVAKRAAFRKAKGLDQYEGIGGWTLRADPKMPDPETRAKTEETIPGEINQTFPDNEAPKKKPIKKWLGIW